MNMHMMIIMITWLVIINSVYRFEECLFMQIWHQILSLYQSYLIFISSFLLKINSEALISNLPSKIALTSDLKFLRLVLNLLLHTLQIVIPKDHAFLNLEMFLSFSEHIISVHVIGLIVILVLLEIARSTS